MEKSKVKEILIKAKNEWKSSAKQRRTSLNTAYRALKRRAEKMGSGELFDNFYLIDEAYSSARQRKISKKLRYYCDTLMGVMTWESISDDLAAFFEVLSDELTSEECEAVKDALFESAVIYLYDRKIQSPEIIRALQIFDFSPFLLGYLKYEQILRRDNVYSLLDRETKGLYKEKIKRYSRKRGLTFTEGCERLTDEALSKGEHIGELLPFQKGESAWLIIPVGIFVVLELILVSVIGAIFNKAVVAFIMLVAVFPLWQTSFDLFVPIVARFRESEMLPRLEMSRIPKESAVLGIIASLGTSEEEIKRLFSHLETLSLKTKSRGRDEYAFWGILLDLPESESKDNKDDASIINTAKREIDRLNNGKPSKFVLFTRERVYNEKEGIYTSHERKRGAIIELVRLLKGKKSSLKVHGAKLPEIKYVLTLDADTDMELGALNKMVGTMEHPLNRPAIGERNGVKVVTKGFGILQPAIVNSIESAHKTRFATLVSGIGGIDSYHSSIFNLNSVLFGKGLFCGKGMFDVTAFYETVADAFPDGIILSHDILEGTRLRTGYLSDICFFDSVPSNALSFYKRAHRWVRGDVQSLAFIGRRLPSGEKNPMLSSERFAFLMNFLVSAVPIFQIAGLFLLMWYGAEMITLASFLFLMPCFVPLFNEILRASFHGSLSNILRRFFGDTVTALARESIMLGYRLSSLAFIAFYNFDAIFRAVWRMKISKKKLLEWTTASQSEGVKSRLVRLFAFTFPSFVIGVFMLFFAKLSLCRLLGILWCVFFLIIHCLGKEVPSVHISPKSVAVLKRYAYDMWGYFDKYANASNNFLPPDNVSVFPSSEIACRTSPTNIGLYLLSVLAALDFKFINVSDAADRFEKSLSSIERLPKYRGQLYNWYNTVTLEVIGQEYISTVDSGNFVTSLVALYEGLAEYEKSDKRIKNIRVRIKSIETESDFRFLYDNSRNLFSLGFFTDKEKRDTIVYDMYMSEARTTDYYAIARGIVKDTHWSALSRPLKTSLSGVGVLSWSGTAFEYFMPHLLLPLYKNSFAHEALSYTFSEQMKYSASYEREKVFGVSESGYFSFDESLGYQYRAFGIPSVSRRIERSSQKVISPYSSFLMLRSGAGYVIKNLEILEKIGMYGEFGFYEAMDFVEERVGNKPSAVKSFMSHHIGMSIIAAANAVFDDIFVKRFMRDAEMGAVSQLLKEAVPADATVVRKEEIRPAVQRKKRIIPEKFSGGMRTDASVFALTGRETAAVLFERGILSLDITGKTERISAVRPLDETHGCGIYMFSRVGKEISSPSVSADVSYMFDTGFAEFRQEHLRAFVNLSARGAAVRIRLEASGGEGDVGIYFQPLLTALTKFRSHPAFSSLFFKAENKDGALILTRVGEEPFSLALVSNNPFEFELSKENLFVGEEYSISSLKKACYKMPSSKIPDILVSPCVFAKSRFTERTNTTFVIGFGRTKSEAISCAKDELATPEARSVRQSRELFYSAMTASGGNVDKNTSEALLSVYRPSEDKIVKNALPPVYGRGSVYSIGLSGNIPVFLIKEGIKREELVKLLLCHKLHYIMGLRYELIIEVNDSGYSRGGRGEAESIINELQCSFMLGKEGGIRLADINITRDEMLMSLATRIYPETARLKKFPFTESVVLKKDCNIFEDGSICIKDKPEILQYHIIASPTFGTILSHRALGNTWVYNSGLSRITFWENDSVGGRYSEKIYLEKDGQMIDLCASARGVKFSCGRAEYMGHRFNIKVAIHPTLMFKAVRVTVEDDAYSLIYKFLPVLGDFPSPCTKVEYFSDEKNSVKFKNLFSDTLTKGFAYVFAPFEKEISYTEDISVMCEKGGEVVFVLGYAGSEKHFEAVKKYFSCHRFSQLYDLSYSFIYDLLKHEKNTFISYQVLISRFFARSGPYQSGGAWGFRDQAQDCLTILDICPNAVRNHILRMAAHQYKEGDVCHWWHKGRGVRTRCSDDYLWLVWLTAIYVERTHDKNVLSLEVPYLVSEPLGEKERDRYESFERTREKYPLSHHLTSALSILVKRGVGSHSIPFVLGGDWNDGMNMLPEGSESVWLGFFARIVIHLYSRMTGDNSFDDFSLLIREGIESNAFFSDRYARIFLPDGRVLGVEGSEYFEIDSLPQSFAALCHSIIGDGNESRITLALDTMWDKLYDSDNQIFKLFTPPISGFTREIGYLSAYPEGVRENGGQYTHAAVWAALAYLSAPKKIELNRKRAELLAKIIDPASHDKSAYKTEPYVLAGDVYMTGRGGWSWYTGSASWYRDLILRISDENRNKRAPLT